MPGADIWTMTKQCDRFADRFANVHFRIISDLWASITQKVRDNAVQPVGFTQDNTHQIRLDRFTGRIRLKDLDGSAHRTERIAYLVSEAGTDAADGRQPLFSPDALLHRAYFGKILKRD